MLLRVKTNKKGLSEIIAYVLLIVVAISLSLLVYAWLKGQMPGKTEQCPEGINLVIEDYSCSGGVINLTLRNKGLFVLEGIIIKASDTIEGLAICPLTKDDGYYHFKNSLKPGNKTIGHFVYSDCGNIVKIEIIPTRFVGGERLLCENSITEYEVSGC